MKQKVTGIVNDVKAVRMNDIDDIIYKRLIDEGKKAMQLIKTVGG